MTDPSLQRWPGHPGDAPPGMEPAAVRADIVESGRDVRHPADDRSIGDIMGDLTRNVSTLMRQEVALAKAEASQSAKRAGKGVGMLAGAGVAGHFVLLFLSLALWWGLAVAIGTRAEPALGWSGIIVAAIWAVIAAILAATGRTEIKRAPGLEQTTETVQQIPNALKGQEQENR